MIISIITPCEESLIEAQISALQKLEKVKIYDTRMIHFDKKNLDYSYDDNIIVLSKDVFNAPRFEIADIVIVDNNVMHWIGALPSERKWYSDDKLIELITEKSPFTLVFSSAKSSFNGIFDQINNLSNEIHNNKVSRSVEAKKPEKGHMIDQTWSDERVNFKFCDHLRKNVEIKFNSEEEREVHNLLINSLLNYGFYIQIAGDDDNILRLKLIASKKLSSVQAENALKKALDDHQEKYFSQPA